MSCVIVDLDVSVNEMQCCDPYENTLLISPSVGGFTLVYTGFIFTKQVTL